MCAYTSEKNRKRKKKQASSNSTNLFGFHTIPIRVFVFKRIQSDREDLKHPPTKRERKWGGGGSAKKSFI